MKKRRRPRRTRFWLVLLLLSAIAGRLVFAVLFLDASGDGYQGAILDRIRRQLSAREQESGEPLSLLLIGSDSRGEEGARSDTLIFMQVNFADRRAYMVSIPRDTRVVIPGRGQDKINAAYAYGGAGLVVRTTEEFLGAAIDNFVEIDFEGFEQMVDALGGIVIDVKNGIDDQSSGYSMRIPAGRQKMDGETALNYVRYRHGDSDFGRAERQQEFLRALAANTLRARTVFKLPRIIEILDENVSTDLSEREMLALGNWLRKLPKDRLETITLAGESKMIRGVSFVEPDPLFLAELMERIEDGRPLGPMKSIDESGKMSMENRPAFTGFRFRVSRSNRAVRLAGE